ncbi:MAG: hypothetical protein KAR07_08240 [Spirochaetes bacterium]|nr:hypothetical protein [Spirochaetota bacterium]MCK5268142.1 hypothetical protein [Spirochaetota bacterium]
MNKNRIFQFIGITLLTIATLGLEVSLTRIFSVTFWYNFVFMIISIALLGTGLSGVILSFGKPHNLSEKKINGLLTTFTVLFAVSIVFAFLRLNKIDLRPEDAFRDSKQWWNMVEYYGVLLIPFLFSGLSIGLIFVKYSKDISKFYFFDLIGAGIGCLIILILIPSLGGESTVFMIALVALLAGLFFSLNLKPWWPALILVLGILFVPHINKAPEYINLIGKVKNKRQYRGKIVYKTWNNFSYCVITDSPGRGWKGVNLDFACFTPIYKAGTRAYGSHAIPFRLLQMANKKPVVALIGSGGGREVQASIDYNAKRIYAIEFNPTIVKVLKGRYSKFTGHLHNKKGVKLIEAEGRSFIRNADDMFDLIVQNNTLTQTASTAGAYALAEDYVLTVEAFVDYIRKLNNGGILYISQPKQLGVRMVTIAIEAFREMGLKNIADSVCSMASTGGYTREFIMIKKGGFTPSEIKSLRTMGPGYGLRINYLPGYKNNSVHKQLIDASDKPEKLEAIYKNSFTDIRPSTDNWPFFSQRAKFKNIGLLISELTRKKYKKQRGVNAISASIKRNLAKVYNKVINKDAINKVRDILTRINRDVYKFRNFTRRDMLSYKDKKGNIIKKENVIESLKTMVNNMIDETDNIKSKKNTASLIQNIKDDEVELKDALSIFFQWGYYDFKILKNRLPQSLGILVVNLVQALLFALVCIFLPLIFFKRSGLKELKPKGRFFLYFMALGFGFMFLEISLMQRFTLFLGHPIYAITTTLFVILISSGVGAFISGKLERFKNPMKAIKFALIMILIMTFFHILIVPMIFKLFLGTAMWLRIIISFIVLIPLGFAMGMLFPSGIRWASVNAPDAVSWAWGVNGFTSVLAAVLSVLIAMAWGFNAVILISLAIYAIGALSFMSIERKKAAG